MLPSMMSLLESSSWVFSSLVAMFVGITVCMFILWLVRKHFSVKELQKSHDVVGFTFSIVGVLYSVILGFTVISAQTRYSAVQETIHSEAIILAELYQDAAFFPQVEQTAIRTALRNYVNHVITEEWESTANRKPNPKTRIYLREIWNSYTNIILKDEKTNVWYTESISKLNSFTNARLARQFNAFEHLGSMMWSLLVIGAFITVGFMFLFGLENWRSHMLMTAILAGYLSFMLYLVYSLDNVFTGAQRIQPSALIEVQTFFDQLDKDPLQNR